MTRVLGSLIGKAKVSSWVVVSHLQFANDTIIFCDNFQRQIMMLQFVLKCFEVVLGLHLNLAKSTLIVVRVVPNLD